MKKKIFRKYDGLIRRVILKYREKIFFWFTCNRINIFYGKNIRIIQKVNACGQGTVNIEKNVQLGVFPSPNFYNGECYLEARNLSSKITINDSVFINNNARIIADKSQIEIGSHTLIGPNFFCVDSDFHSLKANKRLTGHYTCKPVNIGNNVFIGDSVMVLKGVTIGNNSVIGAGCIIDFDVPENVIVSRCSSNYKMIPIRDNND